MTPGSTDPAISGPATVVCCDLKGSTALAERVDPESWRAVLTRYFHELEVVHVAHGGTVVKIIGDAIVTVFEGDDAALWATSAAVTAAASVAVLNDDFEQTWGLRIANRTGVATGVVADGDVLTSDVLNIAESLESHAPPLGVLVDRSTRELLGDDATTLAVGAVQRKGRPGEVEAWRIESVTATELGLPLADPLTHNAMHESRRTVTIVFANPAPAAASSSEPEAEVLRAVTERFLAVARAIIERHGGTVESFIGDSLMAVFGLAVRNEDDAVRAVARRRRDRSRRRRAQC